jgi:recombinational DNA repair protein (RecF pathway)
VDALLAGAPPRVVGRYAQAWVLRLHGVLPDAAACVSCGADLTRDGGTWHWSVHGIACGRCLKPDAGPAVLAEDVAFLESVRRAAPGDVAAPSPHALRRVGVLLSHLLREFLGRELKSEKFLEEIDRLG